jgi:Trypsin-like peptidase domain
MAWETACVAVVLTAMLGCRVAAQTLEEGRAPLIDGQVQDVKKELSSLEGPPEGRIAVVHGLPTARTIKLRLEHVAGSNVASGVAVLVRDAGNNEVARYPAEKLAEERFVWTPEIRGASAQIEVTGSTPAGAEFRVLIAAVASHVPPSRPTLNIVGEFDLEDIEKVRVDQPEIFNAGRSVAKISFVSALGPAACTGFMVSDNRMLTNHHCINTDEICKSADVIFGFDNSSDPLGDEVQKCVKLVDKDECLDAALIEVSGSPGTRWGFLAFGEATPTVPEPTVVIQHPAGFHKFVSRKDCVVATMPADGVKAEICVATTPADKVKPDFGHTCDTEDGSSGSPVLRRADLKVIGLHHWGFVTDDKDWGAQNRAVQISLVKKRFGL